MKKVWILDDDKSIRWVFEKALEKALISDEDLTVEQLIKRTLKNL